MKDGKVMTFWVRPAGARVLPPAKEVLPGVLEAFYQVFPEYHGSLTCIQSPRLPRYVFVCAGPGCNGLLPPAGRYLQALLERAFPGAEVRPYGKAWLEASR
ncbi:hypothetical protein [Meiothermus rufus]|uniref:hypothetical protein n=1 Tax=Meiothermus rufus TaxID=604332 RepID=UPI0004055676|nr:hypothetical protein [Meiothermus rufus]